MRKFSNPRSSASQRFRQTQFQHRIREARGYRRAPRITPVAKTTLKVAPFRYGTILGVAAILTLLASTVYLISFSDFFLVTTVSVSGNNQIASNAIESAIRDLRSDRLFGIIPRSHMLLMSQTRLAPYLANKFPKLIGLQKVVRIWPRSLELTIEERRPVAIWQSQDKFFLLGHDGIIADQLPPGYATSTRTYLRIEDLTGSTVESGQRIASATILKFISLLQTEWDSKIGTLVESVRVEGPGSGDASVATQAGWTALFDLTTNPAQQLGNLSLILRAEIPDQKKNQLRYIDVRLASVAYYCYREEPCDAIVPSSKPENIQPAK